MPDESLITQIELILEDIIDLGGQNERTKILPNLVVQDANPAGLTGFVIVSDGRDGDNILAKKVPSVVYANNDTVNVLFQKGGEAIAFQQGSQSGSGDLWEIVPSTSTDIYYDKGDVGIGKSVAPDAALEVLSTSQAQLRLTHTEDTKYVNFTLDTNHDLTVKPTSTGQIILQPTTDSTDFFQVLDADGGTPVLNVDSTNERVGVGTSAPQKLLQVGVGTDAPGVVAEGAYISIDGNASLVVRDNTNNVEMFGLAFTSQGYFGMSTNHKLSFRTNNVDRMTLDTAGRVGIGTTSPIVKFEVIDTITTGAGVQAKVANLATITNSISLLTMQANNGVVVGKCEADGLGTGPAGAASFNIGTFSSHPATLLTGNTIAVTINTSQDVGVGIASPAAQLHVDQSSTTAAQPVLYLDQADISEEMIEFNTTIGVGNAIEAVGAKTLTPTHFIKVTLPGGLTRYFEVGTIA